MGKKLKPRESLEVNRGNAFISGCRGSQLRGEVMYYLPEPSLYPVPNYSPVNVSPFSTGPEGGGCRETPANSASPALYLQWREARGTGRWSLS